MTDGFVLVVVVAVRGSGGDALAYAESHKGGIVLSGEIEWTVGEQVRVLKAGNAYLFDSRQPHRFRNNSDSVVEIVTACTPPYL